MRLPINVLLVAVAALSLAGCNLTTDIGELFGSKRSHEEARASMPLPQAATETTGSITPPPAVAAVPVSTAKPKIGAVQAVAPREPESDDGVPAMIASPVLPGNDGKDDVRRGMELYRAGNYAEAEGAFDRAAKLNPRDAEAWLGLAAVYDRMRRFELADRAYVQAASIKGPTAEILNNQGYSQILRGDLTRARTILQAALKKEPGNKFVQSNLKLLESKERSAKAQ